MAVVQTCKCDECGIQKSFANHWVMLRQRGDELLILPAWDESMLYDTMHFCGRAHACRFVDRWLTERSGAPAEAPMAMPSLIASTAVSRFPQASSEWLEDEEAAAAARASVRYA